MYPTCLVIAFILLTKVLFGILFSFVANRTDMKATITPCVPVLK